ncbi:hypothetical protein [Lysinibacillus sp. JNUCC 51]|uniref:hypothetical protein n=1 Tax=Lysinibacillus sp. JNUCC-51 TaxID=2792479 RepID=UPI0019385512|nr:hypothetical protein JNUCC51_03015 [Lysinibacillus sp. JNUCC-51]
MAKAKRQQQMFYLYESEATATMFYLRESEASAANVLSVAKAKRQQQMFYLCESEATATNVLSARKRSVSGKCFLRGSDKSAQSERKSTTLYVKGYKFEDGYSPFFIIFR